MEKPVFIVKTTGYLYSRPCFNGAGDEIIFMRTKAGREHAPTGLYTVSASGEPAADPALYFQPDHGTFAATRPAWCWANGNVAFTGSPVNSDNNLISADPSSLGVIEGGPNSGYRTVPINTTAPRGPATLPDGTHNYSAYTIFYPSWYPDGVNVSATNYGPYQAIKMSTVNGDFMTLTAPSSTTPPDPGPKQIWVGMTSASAGDGNPIAFAGQKPSEFYHQENNQIWIQETGKNPYRLEGSAAQQGRAPWFSPSGDRVAFESNRQTNGNLQLFISPFPFRNGPVQGPLTPDTWICQHPKWSPDGRWLTFGAQDTISGEHGICVLKL